VLFSSNRRNYNRWSIKPLAGIQASKVGGALKAIYGWRFGEMSKRIASLLFLIAILGVGAVSAVVAQDETDDPVKIQIYTQFYQNHENNKSAAYKAARDYLARYTKDKDRYVDYLQKWTAAYERDERKRMLPGLINEKNFSEAYSTGARILTDEPDNLRAQIDLGYAGYIALSSNNTTYTADALGYARKAISAIESGKVPSEWAPFKGKDDTLAYLNFGVGFMILKTTPVQAIDSFFKAAGYDSDIKKNPRTFYGLAAAYESGPYKTLSAAYQTNFGGKDETAQSKAALEKINVVIDRMIDAYARAIALATDPSMEQSKSLWMGSLTNYWKFRHAGAETGLTEFISSSLSRPLPPKPAN
jgi:tetratricopeptide (TPR) repeat protein